MMIAIEVSTRNALWLPMLIASSSSVRMPITSAGTIGTLRVPETRAIWVPNGRRPSRAIENSMRIHGGHHREVADDDRDRRVGQEHVAGGVAEGLLDDVGQAEQRDVLVVDVLHGHHREQDQQAADQSRGRKRADDRRAARACAVRSSPRRASRGVEPVHDVGTHDPADEKRAEVAPADGRRRSRALRDDRRCAVRVEEQQDDQEGRADQLGDHAEVVDARHELDAEHVDDRPEGDQDRSQQQRVLRPALGDVSAGVGGWPRIWNLVMI